MVRHKRRLMPPTKDNEGGELWYASPVKLKGSGVDDTPIWHLRLSDEYFTSYEAYLKRLDFLKSRQFMCEHTGYVDLTYTEAVKSEAMGGLKDSDMAMPEPLKFPILKKVQFNLLSTADDVVDWIYEEFKEEFFPGEHVIVRLPNSDNLYEGVIRDKASFPARYARDGSLERPALSRYFVQISGEKNREALVDQGHVFRHSKSFNKAIVRSFLSRTLVKPESPGRPWNLKSHVATLYQIETAVPKELDPQWIADQERLKAEEARMMKQTSAHPAWLQELALLGKLPGHEPGKALAEKDIPKWQKKFQKSVAGVADGVPITFATGKPLPMNNGIPGHYKQVKLSLSTPPPPQPKAPPKPIPPKYPTEDLDVPPKPSKAPRPPLKYLADAPQFQNALTISSTQGIDALTTGMLLETWNTLNVFTYFYCLDSFTFDDFVEAMLIASEDIYCELFEEVHCAVLKAIVNDQGEIMMKSLANLTDPTGDSSSPDTSLITTPVKEIPPQPTPSRKSARKAAAEHEATNGTSLHQLDDSRIEDLLEQDEWVERLAARNFTNGGWQTIVCGLLEKLSLKPSNKALCDNLLAKLVPTTEIPSQETVRSNYSRLDITSRVSILQKMILLTVETKPFKEFMETCMRDMTDTRKSKVRWQSTKKPLVKRLVDLNEQRKLLNPDGAVDTEIEEQVKEADEDDDEEDEEMEDAVAKQESSEEEEEDDDDEDIVDRRTSGRATNLKRKREEEEARKEKEKKAKVENDDKQKYEQVLTEIKEVQEEIKECEKNIEFYEDQLRENSCHRTKVLGQDRFMNRYYWYERNGMQFGGDDGSSTAHYDYANARIWVQGPDELDRAAMIDLPNAEQNKYKEAFGTTVPKRKALEEGETQLRDAREWAFYDSPEDLDKLIEWLDDRGYREKGLRKELRQWRDRIAEYMDHLHTHLEEIASRREGSEEPVTGVATRKRNYVEHNTTKYPALAWRNLEAFDRIGQLHSTGPIAKKNKRGMAIRAKKEEQAAAEPRSTRSGYKYKK